MKNKAALIKPGQILNSILLVREQRVILDTDLARIYGVSVKRLNEQIKRNRRRFPEDFMLRLTAEEIRALRSQYATLAAAKNLRSQIATSNWGGRRYLPCAFTEQGAIMAASVLNSERAIEMSVFVVRAFVKMRALLSSNKGLAEELKKLEKKLTGRLDVHEIAIVDVLRRLIKLLEPEPSGPDPKPKGPIGFQP